MFLPTVGTPSKAKLSSFQQTLWLMPFTHVYAYRHMLSLTLDAAEVVDEVAAMVPKRTKVGDPPTPLDEEEHVKGLRVTSVDIAGRVGDGFKRIHTPR